MTAPAPQVTMPRHPFELLFQQLSGAMSRVGAPVVHELGPVAGGVAAQPGRIVWTDKGPGASEPIGYTIPGTVTIGRQPCEYTVDVYGSSPADVLQKCRDIEGWLDNLVGPPKGAPPPAGNGYKIGKASAPVAVGDGTSTGCGAAMDVTLYLPIFSEVRPSLLVGHPSVTATASGSADGPTNDGHMSWQG